MTAALFALPVALTLVTAPASLETAYKREVALLEAERDALVKARDHARAAQRDRAAQLRKELAALEAALVSARAKNDTLTTRLQGLERAAAVDPGSLAPTLTALTATLRAAGVEPDARDLPALLDTAVTAIERGRVVQRIESGFFDETGRYVDGTIVRVGDIAAVGASPDAAGPLVAPGGEGPGQIVDAAFAALSRSFVERGGAAPLFLGTELPKRQEEMPGLIDEVRDAGAAAWVVLVLGGLLVVLGVMRGARLVLAARSARRALGPAAELVEGGEIGAAEALCRAVVGPAGPLWATVVASSSRAALDDVEESAAEALLDANAALARGDRVLAAGAVVLVLVGALGAVQSGGRALLSLEHALALAVPVAVLVAGARIAADRLEREMERGALRLVDAARRARVGRA